MAQPSAGDCFAGGWTFVSLAREQEERNAILLARARPLFDPVETRPSVQEMEVQMLRPSKEVRKQLDSQMPTMLTMTANPHPAPSAALALPHGAWFD